MQFGQLSLQRHIEQERIAILSISWLKGQVQAPRPLAHVSVRMLLQLVTSVRFAICIYIYLEVEGQGICYDHPAINGI